MNKKEQDNRIAIAQELSEREKIRISKMFPNLNKFKKKQEKEKKLVKYRLRLVDVIRLEFLEKLPQRVEGYLSQITQQIKTIKSNEENINNLSNKIDKIVEKLEEKETQRRKAAGKVGGLTASLNKEKEKTEHLIEDKVKLENTIELKELELQEKEAEIKILKNLGKKKQMSDYKKLQEIRKDIDNKKRIKGVNYE